MRAIHTKECERARRVAISSGGNVQHAAEQARHHVRIGDFRRHGESRNPPAALMASGCRLRSKNVGALRADFDDELLLVLGAGQ